MRLYLKLSKNKQIVPYDYQVNLVGAFHKWLGKNEVHDSVSLYSMSGLSGNTKSNTKGLSFPYGAEWFISSPNEEIIKQILRGIMEDASVAFGMVVKEAMIRETPVFNKKERFSVASPVFIKRTVGERQEFFYYNQIESDNYLTETLKTKLKKGGVSDDNVIIRFDRDFPNPKIKKVRYKGIDNKANICPVIIEGSPEQIGFAWDVGVGNSTGIGFGSLV